MGNVLVQVWGHRNEPLKDQSILLGQEVANPEHHYVPGDPEGYQAKTDSAGLARIANVPVGEYQVWFAGTHAYWRIWRQWTLIGEVAVLRDAEAYFPIALQTTRTFSGSFLLEDYDELGFEPGHGIVMKLELYPASLPDRLIGVGETTNGKGERGGRTRDWNEDESIEDGEAPPDMREFTSRGEFHFTGLPPDYYRLKLIISAEGSHLIREVDLTEGDVHWSPQMIRFFGDFSR